MSGNLTEEQKKKEKEKMANLHHVVKLDRRFANFTVFSKSYKYPTRVKAHASRLTVTNTDPSIKAPYGFRNNDEMLRYF